MEIILFFFVTECDLDLKGLESHSREGGLYEEVFCGSDLSLEYERDLYLGRESRVYIDL